MPGHAYTTYTTTLEHTPCTEVIGYTHAKLSQHTSCSSSVDSGHNASYTEPLEYNSSMEDLLHVHTPYTLILVLWDVTPTYSCTLELIHTQWAHKLPSLRAYHSLIPKSHHAPLQSTYHCTYRILLQYIWYTESYYNT